MTSFKCLAIETATPQGSVAACIGERRLVRQFADGQTSSRALFAEVASLLDELGLTAAELDCIACGCGPGGFTGVRVAVSAAQGLAYAANVPVVTVSTLATLAAGATTSDATIAASLDARMGEAYVGVYRFTNGTVTNELSDRLVQPNEFRLVDHARDAAAAGGGWAEFPEMLEGFTGEVRADAQPAALSMLTLAEQKFAAGRGGRCGGSPAELCAR